MVSIGEVLDIAISENIMTVAETSEYLQWISTYRCYPDTVCTNYDWIDYTIRDWPDKINGLSLGIIFGRIVTEFETEYD